MSHALGCPYEGHIEAAAVARVAETLFAVGCYEVSLGYTIGVGTPLGVKRLIERVTQRIAIENLASHFHDTYGMAAANIYGSLEMGMTTFDSSAAGLGGCPYAKGASGNVATEDLVWLLNGWKSKQASTCPRSLTARFGSVRCLNAPRIARRASTAGKKIVHRLSSVGGWERGCGPADPN